MGENIPCTYMPMSPTQTTKLKIVVKSLILELQVFLKAFLQVLHDSKQKQKQPMLCSF